MVSFKQKLENVLTNPASGIIDPIFDIDESSAHELAGFIISKSFENMDQIDRQNKIWDYMEKTLKTDELNNVIRLIAVTPDEA